MSENFFSELSVTYNINLSQQQQQAVRHVDGPCLLLAVPGGGKTTTLLSRTAYLIKEHGMKPERLLSITFSRASANDMKSRFKYLFKGTIGESVTFSTIHSFAYGVVMSYMRSQNHQVTLIEGNIEAGVSKGQILRSIYHKINHDYISEGDFELLTGDLSYVKNVMMKDVDLQRFHSDIRNFVEIHQTYEAYKKQKGYIDFDDMLVVCHEVLASDEQVRAFYQNRYEHIQIDEAQDTSRLQHAIIAILADKHQNIFYVADDDQSIYGFRGATPSYLLNLKAVYPKAKVIRMEHNYRSTKAIVDTSCRFIRKNRQRYDKNIHTENQQGLPILIHDVAVRQEQYGEVMNQLEGFYDYGEAAVLYRNNHSAVSMIHALSKTAIPFRLKGLKRRFFDHWVVTDILTMLHFAYAVDDLHAFKSFYYKLRGYYISKQMIQQVEGRFKDMPVFGQLIRSNNLAPYQKDNIRELRDDFGKVASLPVHEAIEYLLTQMGYLEFLMDRTGGPTATFESYNMMLEVLKDLARNADTLLDLKVAVDDMEQLIKKASANCDPNALTLSTIHSAKGLEWTKVFMIDLINGIFPNKDVMDANDLSAMEEERRLFYVGMTRAKSDLVLYRVTGSTPSILVEEVVGILNPKDKKKTVSKKRQNYTKKPVATYDIKSRNISSHEPLAPGTAITHRVYGDGVVKACGDNKILLVFADGEKKLNYGFCMDQGLIRMKL